MAYTTINKSKDHFDGKIYLGSSSAVTVTGLEFQPDLVWVKDRDNANNHCLVDVVRGVGKYIQSDNTSAEVNNSTNSISAFTSDGFTTGTGNPANESASTTKGFMSWNWKAGGGQGSSNTDGSINTTYTSVNTTAGFSISTYTGTGSNATVGHGLGAVPQVVIARNITDTEQWTTYHVGLDATAPQNYHVRLNTGDARVDEASVWNDTAPTSSVFSVGSSGAPNGSGDNHIAYCFAEKTGYSKFGSYKGNGNANGTFVYTGFKPAWVMIKNSTDSSNNWHIYDNKRLGYNVDNNMLRANLTNTEQTDDDIDILSNGFKLRRNSGAFNTGHTYIFMAFGQSLVGSNNVPCTAR